MEFLAFLVIIAVIIFLIFHNRAKQNTPQSENYQQSDTKSSFSISVEGEVSEAFTLPKLPVKFDKDIEAKSELDKELVYNINLYNLTCSCPDFFKRRKDFKNNDIRRVCKHIKTALDRTKAYQYYDGLTNELIYNHMKWGDEFYLELEVDGRKVMVCFKQKLIEPWFNIFSSSEDSPDKYARYGYNLSENRWSYDKAPYNARRIIDEFKKCLTIEN